MKSPLKLPVHFDEIRLQTDLQRILSSDYIPHFNTQYYEGDWSAVPLRSVGGSATQIYPDPTKGDDYTDTPLLARCGYVPEILRFFHCRLLAVRFLRLAPGSVIKEHRDFNLSFEDGELRLHVPVQTNPDVEFILGGQRVVMTAGECWYLNFNLPHRVANCGTTDRIHLVIDCVVNDWLRELLQRAEAVAD